MNEQFEDLMYHAGLTASGCWDEMDDYDRKAIEKFAELIVEEYAREYQKLVNGDSVVLPKNREHAESIVRVGMFYLENSK